MHKKRNGFLNVSLKIEVKAIYIKLSTKNELLFFCENVYLKHQ